MTVCYVELGHDWVRTVLPSSPVMSDPSLPAEVQQLIARHLVTMHHVDVLLLVARTPEQGHTPEEIGTTLQVTASELSRHVLVELESAGLIGRDPARAGALRYAPATAELRRAVELLALAYNEKPVTLIKAIYSRPSAVQTFADTFRLR